MIRLISVLAVLVLVMAAGAYLVPRFIDWDAQRPAIAQRLSEATGRDVSLGGHVTARVLPRPYLAMRELAIAGADGAEPALVRAETAELELAFWPLLRGEVVVESLTLFDGQVTVDAARLGRLAELLGEFANGQAPGARLKLEDAGLAYRRDGDTALALADLQAEANFPGGAAPASLQAHFDLAGTRLRLDGGFEAPPAAGDGGRPLQLTLGVADTATAARLRGTVTEQGGLDATLTAEGDSLGRLLARWPASAGAALAATHHPFELASEVTWQGGVLELAELAAGLGPAEATGRLRLRPPGGQAPPQLVAELAGQRLNLDRLHKQASPGEAASVAAPPGPGAWAELVGSLIPPAPWHGRIALSADSVIAGERVLRQPRLAAPFRGGALRLDPLEADLPASSRLRVTGRIAGASAHGGDVPAAALDVTAESENLRGLLGWLGAGIPDGVAPTYLRTGRLEAELAGWRPEWELADLQATLDEQTVTGAAVIATDGPRPALGIRLAAESFDLDGYLGDAPLGALQGMAGSVDANVIARADSVQLRDRRWQDIQLDAQLQGPALTLREATARAADGLNLGLAGEIGDMTRWQGRDLRLTAEGDDLAARLAALTGAPRLGRVLPGTGRAELVVADPGTERGGDGERPRVAVTADMAEGAELAFDGRLTGGDRAAPELAGTLELTHPRAGPWLRRLGRPSLAWVALDAGAFSLRGDFSGTPQAGRLTDAALTVGPAAGTGELAWDATDTGDTPPEVTAELAFRRLPLDALVATGAEPGAVTVPPRLTTGPRWSTTPFETAALTNLRGDLALTADRASYAGWPLREVALEAALGAGRLSLASARAEVGGGTATASGWLTAGTAADRRPGLDFDLALEGVNLPTGLALGPGYRLDSGRLDLELGLAGRGSHPAALVRRLSGELTVRLRNGTVGGLALPGLREALVAEPGAAATRLAERIAGHLTLPAGQTPVSQLDARAAIAEGEANPLAVQLDGPAGRLSLDGRFDLWRWYLDLAGDLAPTQAHGGPLPTIPLTVTGRPERPEIAAQTVALAKLLPVLAGGPPALPDELVGAGETRTAEGRDRPADPAQLVPLPRAAPSRVPRDPGQPPAETAQDPVESVLQELGGGP